MSISSYALCLQIITIEIIEYDMKPSDTFSIYDANTTEAMFQLDINSLLRSVVNSTR